MTTELSTQNRIAETPSTQYYNWRGYPCAYEVQTPANHDVNPEPQTPLLLLHPIGVGLSRRFWDRFCQAWFASGHRNPIYNPDLLGCGESDMPHVAYQPADWGEQLDYFLQTVVRQPVIVVVQGALLPVAIHLVQRSHLVKALVLSDPPAWSVITQSTPDWQHRVSWNLFDSLLGRAFYNYARRRSFLRSFSIRQLFNSAEAVDRNWLEMLDAGAANPESRYAVFSFLAGFWRQDYESAIAGLNLPTLVVIGNSASSISRAGKSESPDQRLCDYVRHLPRGQGLQITGRNVLPYETSETFVKAITPFIQALPA